MAILGDNTTPAAGFWSDDTTDKQFWNSATYTMPAGGGIVTDMYCYCAGDGTSVTGQLVIWVNGSGAIAWQSGNITLPSGTRAIGGQGWVHVSVPSVYLAAAGYKLGFWSSGNVVWTFESSGGVYERSGISSPQSESGTSDEYAGGGWGYLGVYIVYTPGGVGGINTGSPGTPNWVYGPIGIQTGPQNAPVWTYGRVQANEGSPATPNWIDAT